ncbi:MAG: hypothetical protein ACUVR4_05460 [Anaerolineae bacterium]
MKVILRPALAVVLAAVLLWLSVAPQLSPGAAAQSGPQRAGLVVRFGDGRVETRCITFDAAAISGVELLERSGLQIILDYNNGLGGAVCSIAGEGCAFPQEDCFCRCQGTECQYWAYYHGQDGRWLYSDLGASSYQVTDGALEGWSWGQGSFSAGTEPPFIPFDEVCPPAAAASAEPPAASLVPVARAQGVETGRNGMPSAVEPGVDGARYGTFLLLAAALAAVWAWVSRRRKRAALPAISSRHD